MLAAYGEGGTSDLFDGNRQ